MSCFDEQDLLPYKPGTVEDPEIGRLKRIIALRDSELNCYRQLLPGRKFSAKHSMLVYEPFYEED